MIDESQAKKLENGRTNENSIIIVWQSQHLECVLREVPVLQNFEIISVDKAQLMRFLLQFPASHSPTCSCIVVYGISEGSDWGVVNEIYKNNFHDGCINAKIVTVGNSERCTVLKPISIRRLVAVIASYVKDKYIIGDHTIFDYRARSLCDIDNYKVLEKLAEKEAKMLRYLVENSYLCTNICSNTQHNESKVHTDKARILRDVWGYGDSIDTKTFESHLHRLRSKLSIFGIDV